MLIKDWIKHLQEYPEDTIVVPFFWQGDDIRMSAMQNDIDLSEDEISNIADNLANADAGLGINWDKIEAEINDYLEAKKEKAMYIRIKVGKEN